jgi:type VI protein secretion system component Hcp
MEDEIFIVIRDINGKRDTFEFDNNYAVLSWADNYLTEDDEILIVAQGNLCLYSGLQSSEGLTCDDLTGFFG